LIFNVFIWNGLVILENSIGFIPLLWKTNWKSDMLIHGKKCGTNWKYGTVFKNFPQASRQVLSRPEPAAPRGKICPQFPA
jgi:hypothetical protein